MNDWHCEGCGLTNNSWHKYCSECGTKRPTEKEMGLPEKLDEFNLFAVKGCLDKVIDYLASKPWEEK